MSASRALTLSMTSSAFGAEPLQRDAADDFAFAVELGDAAPLVRRQLDARHVAQQDRRAASVFTTICSRSEMLLR